jgi:hypothetical protein
VLGSPASLISAVTSLEAGQRRFVVPFPGSSKISYNPEPPNRMRQIQPLVELVQGASSPRAQAV